MKKMFVILIMAVLLISLLTTSIFAKENEKGASSVVSNAKEIKAKKILTEKGEEIEIRKAEKEKTKLKADDKEAETELEIEEEVGEQNKTKLKVKLSNGRKAEIKIMPDTASQRAIERLGQLNFTIQLKEVGSGEKTKLVYEIQAERHYKLFGLFRAKAKSKAEIDAETGEVIKIKKPWWAFLAREEISE